MNSKIFVHYFKQFDLFTKPVQLLIKKEVGHKTVLGASFSMLLVITMSIFFINSVIVYSDRTKPVTLTTEVYHAQPDLYKLKPQNFTLQFAFQDSSFATYIDETIYNVEALLVKKEVIDVNGTTQINYITKQLPITRCSQDIIRQESLSQYFSHFDLNTNYCIDWNKIDEINMQGTFDAHDYQYILLKFKMCNQQNNTENLVTCQSQEDIIKQLTHNYLSLQISSYYVDLQNPNNPYIPKGEDFFTTISSQIFKEITLYLQPVTTYTDTGAFFEDTHYDTTVKYNQQTEMIDFNDGYLLANVAIRLHTIEQVNYRQYSRVQTVLAELGGLWNVLFTIAMIIQAPISTISYKLQIVNSLFNFEGQEETQNDEQEHHLIFENQEIPMIASKQSSKVYTENQFRNISTDFQLTNRQLVSPSRNVNTPIKKSKFQRQDSFRSSIRSQQSKVQQKLQEINKQCIKIQNVAAIDDEQKEKQLTKLNQQIKGFFQTVSKRLRISFFQYLKNMIVVSQEDQQVRQLNFSISRMEKSFDVLYIIKKLHEIDKLKMILLNKDQIRLFDYLPKPTITAYPDKDIQVQQYFSILKPIKSNFQMALDAQQAFRVISNKLNDPINQQLVNCMDESMLEFLQFQIYKNENEQGEEEMLNEGPVMDNKQKRIDTEQIQDQYDNQSVNNQQQ